MLDKLKATKLTSIGLGVIIAILLIIIGFKMFQSVFTRAADSEPRDVVISNILQNTAKVGWATGNDTQGVIEYGTSPTALNFYAPEIQATKIHSLELTLLSPNTTYYFDLRIGDKKYDNGGVPWTFTTKSTEKSVAPTSAATSTNTISKPTPTPYQELVVPGGSGSSLPIPTVVSNCTDTDCQKICQKLGRGCSTSDFIRNKCVGKVSMNNCSISATTAPTATPMPH